MVRQHQMRAKRYKSQIDYDVLEFRLWVESHLDFGCEYCGKELTFRTFSIDHRIPLSRSGESKLHNLAVCCSTCNFAKGILSDDEFRNLLTLTKLWPESIVANFLGRLKAGARIVRS